MTPAKKKAPVVDDGLSAFVASLPQRYEAAVELASLVEFPGNPKQHDLGAIITSIERNGMADVIKAQAATRYILGGHGTCAALRMMGWMHVPVLWIDCDDRTARRLVLAYNRTTELGGMDTMALADFLTPIADAGDLLGSGYDGDDLDTLKTHLALIDAQPPAPTTTDDDDDERAPRGAPFLIFARERVLDEAFAYFRARSYPYKELPLFVQLQEMNRLAALSDEAALRSTRGYGVADTYHPHRLAASAGDGKRSPLAAYDDDAALKHALAMTLDNGAALTTSVPGFLSIVHGTQACSNFRPAFAMALYRRFAPLGGTVLDPCTGYGGRLTGWIASQRGGRYVGVDPNVPTHNANAALAATLAPPDGVSLINLPFEDVNLDEHGLRGRCDFVFTSPPYFTKEHYSDDETQSWKRYPAYEDWRESFLRVLLASSYAALVPGATCIINIADVKIGGTTYALERDTVTLARDAGFRHVTTERFQMGARAFGRGEDTTFVAAEEPVLVFEK